MDEKQYIMYKNAVKKYRESLEKGNPDKSNASLETRYKNSFKISIDVSKLLKVYNSYLKNLNQTLSNINIENEKKLGKYRAMNEDLSKKIIQMQEELSDNVRKLKSGVKNKKMSNEELTHYNNLINRIKKDTATLIF